MRRSKTSKSTVWRWRERYLDEGVGGLKRDKTRPSRVPPLPRETRLKVIAKTVQESPPNATHCSRSSMAKAVGISPSSVGRIWTEAGLKPHLTKPFKVSKNPMFEEKVTHKTPEVEAWLKKHPSFKLHFTPTSTSRLNIVERFFAEITSKRIRRCSYTSVAGLETGHLRLPVAAQRQTKALHMDQIGRGHPHPRTTRPERTR